MEFQALIAYNDLGLNASFYLFRKPVFSQQQNLYVVFP